MTELGFRGNEEWTDMSNFVVHFTKGVPGKDQSGKAQWVSPAQVLTKILLERILVRGTSAWGAAQNLHFAKDTQRSVCFSEIPLGYLHRLVARRNSSYGVAFRKPFIFKSGGAPVWYVDRNSPVELVLNDLRLEGLKHKPDNRDHPIWKVTPFMDHPFDNDGRQWRFEWEREWRIPADVSFAESDVAFLFLPEEDHAAWRTGLDKLVQSHGLHYPLRFIDPLWQWDRMLKECEPIATS